ncbi:MAG: hypothetical protein ACRDR6_10500 [Pseudonocardiaceae bacterium]
MIDDQRCKNEPDTPSPITEYPVKIKPPATALLNQTSEWTPTVRLRSQIHADLNNLLEARQRGFERLGSDGEALFDTGLDRTRCS